MTIIWFGILKADETSFEGSWSIAVAISLLAMVLIGGLGSVSGAVWGAAFVFGLPLALQLLLPDLPILADLAQGDGGFTPVVLTAFAYGALIVLVVVFEPGGLAAIGRRIRARLRLNPLTLAEHHPRRNHEGTMHARRNGRDQPAGCGRRLEQIIE